MIGQAGFWNHDNSLQALPTESDPLEKLDRTLPFEKFRPLLLKVSVCSTYPPQVKEPKAPCGCRAAPCGPSP